MKALYLHKKGSKRIAHTNVQENNPYFNIINPVGVTIDNVEIGMKVLHQFEDFGIGEIIKYYSTQNCKVKFNGIIISANIGKNNCELIIFKDEYYGKNNRTIEVQRHPFKIREGNRRRRNSIQTRTSRARCEISNIRNEKRAIEKKKTIAKVITRKSLQL